MTVYAILSKVEEPVPSGKIDFVASNDGKTGTAFTVPSGITKVRVTVRMFQGLDSWEKINVISVTAGQTLYAKRPPFYIGYPGSNMGPIAVRSQTLEYGPKINKLQEGFQ